jgi:hypothetical protein
VEDLNFTLSDHAMIRIEQRKLERQWVVATLKSPDLEEPHPQDADCRIAYKAIAEADGRVLKVVYNTSTDPIRVVTVHFDRRMRGKL